MVSLIQYDLWSYWNTNGTTMYSSTATWQNWNVITSSTSITYDIFENWVAYTDNHRRYVPVILPAAATRPVLPPTPEEIAAVRAREEERKIVRAAAESRARGLLLESLTPSQRADYEKTKHFNVRARSGRRYRIRCGRAHNVFWINNKGLALTEYCGHVADGLPNDDNILAQKLMLEHDEEAFLRIANRINYPQPRQLHPLV